MHNLPEYVNKVIHVVVHVHSYAHVHSLPEYVNNVIYVDAHVHSVYSNDKVNVNAHIH